MPTSDITPLRPVDLDGVVADHVAAIGLLYEGALASLAAICTAAAEPATRRSAPVTEPIVLPWQATPSWSASAAAA